MKNYFKQLQHQSVRFQIPPARRHAYWAVIALASLACGGVATAQTTNAPPANSADTNAPTTGSSTNVTKLNETTVTAKLNAARSQILPDLGASSFTFTQEHIQTIPGGNNAPFNQVLLRAPGVTLDSAVNGDLHVRGEHANLQYRIDDVLVPESLSGFGLELDPRFVDSMKLITGSLPAQYGFRTTGIVDIQTKSGLYENGGNADIYGGSHDTIKPSFEYGGSTSNIDYYFEGSYLHTSLGIENPVSTHEAIHDISYQGKFFTHDAYIIDDTSRLSLILSASDSNYQIPDVPGDQGPGPFYGNNAPPLGLPASFNSANLNENQNEQNYYAALSYQKAAGDLNFQISALGRRSEVHFMPDQTGDLFFFGVASDVDKTLNSGGLEFDASYQLGENHTLRGGAEFIGEFVSSDTTTTVFNENSSGAAFGSPFPIVDNGSIYGLFTGFYLQDEWKIFEKLTLNYGGRFDIFNSSFDNENQLSPRVNLVYKPFASTMMHVGYAHYFTPPAPEFVSSTSLDKYVGTSNFEGLRDSPIQCERADYYDAGINQQIMTNLTVGVDAYFKHSHNMIDDGLFGQSLILSTFNYSQGQQDGVELTVNYTHDGFSAYGNLAFQDAIGTGINSAQFLFGPSSNDGGNPVNYTDAGNWIHLDHLATIAASLGVSYRWEQSAKASLTAFVDAIYGSGLRTDLNLANPVTLANGETVSTIPNGGTLQSYYPINIGLEERFQIGEKKFLKARLDVVNICDQAYELRNGFGVGVGAPQWGMRRSYYATLGFQF